MDTASPTYTIACTPPTVVSGDGDVLVTITVGSTWTF